MTEGEAASFAISCVALWVIIHSPILRWASVFAVCAAWGLGTVGATLFVIFVIHVPAEQYVGAIGTLVFGGFVSAFWFAYGLPFMIEHCLTIRESLKLWDKR
jgi:hypothetical protein